MYLPLELVLVRHGESEGNVASRKARAGDYSHFTPEFCYRPASEWHLTKRGEKQAIEAGRWLREQKVVNFDFAISSDYYRASETLYLMGEEFYKANGSTGDSHLIRERNQGLLDLKLRTEVHEKYREAQQGRHEDPFHWLPPGGESIAHVVERARVFLASLPLLSKKYDRVMVVSHGEMMWAFRVLLEGISPEELQRLHHSDHPGDRIYNCHVLHYKRMSNEDQYSRLRSACTYNPDRWDSKWHLINKKVALV